MRHGGQEGDDTMRLRVTADVQKDVARRITDAAAILDEGGDPRGELRQLIAELESHPDADLLEAEIALLEDLHGQIDGALRADYGYRASPEWLAAVSDNLDARNPGSTATRDDLARLDENLFTIYRRLDPDPLAPPPPSASTAGGAPIVPVTEATPDGDSACDSGEGNAAAGPRSDLYKEPVPFQGRSLEGAPPSGDPTELARSLEAEIPIEDLLPIEPCPEWVNMKSIVISDPVVDVKDEDDVLVERRVAYAEKIRTRSIRGRDSGRGGAGGRTEAQAKKAANDRWAAFVSAKRTSPISFSDDPYQILYLVECGSTSYSDESAEIADPYRGVDPENTRDCSHAAHYIPEPRGRKPDYETGFGRVSHGWNEFPFSCRERILNVLSRDESLNPARIATLEAGFAGCHAAPGKLSSSQCRSMTNMISDLGDRHRHARWHMHGSRGKRLPQLIEMLDHAVVVV